MTQSQLAAMLGKSEGAVRAWEIDRSKPDADTLIFLAKHFGCTSDYLLGLSDYRNTSEEEEIAASSKTLEEAIAKISGGSLLLKNLTMFVDIADKKDMGWIVSKYLAAAGFFLHSLVESDKLADKFRQTQSYDIVQALNCMLNMVAAGTKVEKSMKDVTSQLLHSIRMQTEENSSKIEKQLTAKLLRAYKEKELEELDKLDDIESPAYTNTNDSLFETFGLKNDAR